MPAVAREASKHLQQREVELDVEDALQSFARFLKTPVNRIHRRGNSLMVTVPVDVANELGIKAGSKCAMLRGNTISELVENLNVFRAYNDGRWILLIFTSEKEEW
ncbi:MAG: AbrB/MazE/SpoVT family DNA-binding domain-containing protein [Candidatus Caldarchaeum sp.]